MSSQSLAAFLLTTLMGVFCVGITQCSEVEGEISLELEECLVHRRDCSVDKSLGKVRLPFKPHLSPETPASLAVPLGFRSERSALNGLGTFLRT